MVIEKLLVTHGHLDHVGAVRDLADALRVPVEGPHVDDRFWIEQLAGAGADVRLPAVAQPSNPTAGWCRATA